MIEKRDLAADLAMAEAAVNGNMDPVYQKGTHYVITEYWPHAIRRAVEAESDNTLLREELAAAKGREATLKQIILNLLISADCSWDDRGKGHDWPEECQAARKALETPTNEA